MPIRVQQDNEYLSNQLGNLAGKNIFISQFMPMYTNVSNLRNGHAAQLYIRGQLTAPLFNQYKDFGKAVIGVQNTTPRSWYKVENGRSVLDKNLQAYFDKNKIRSFYIVLTDDNFFTTSATQNEVQIITEAQYKALGKNQQPIGPPPKPVGPAPKPGENIIYTNKAMTVNTYWANWAKSILQALNLKPTTNRIQFLYAWMAGENTKAKNNPLATTWDMKSIDPGQTNFNYNGGYPVKQYSSPAIGLKATINTLRGGYYPEILRFLKEDKSIGAATTALLSQLQIWGTGRLPLTIWQSWTPDFKKKLAIGGGAGIALAICLLIAFRKKIFN